MVDRAILDKEVVVGQGAIVGDGPDYDTPNQEEPGRLITGITVVGKREVIPRGVRIGRNVKVAGDVRSSDITGRVVKSGATVERSLPRKPRVAVMRPDEDGHTDGLDAVLKNETARLRASSDD